MATERKRSRVQVKAQVCSTNSICLVESTITSTKVEAPGGVVTVYTGEDGRLSTMGLTTIFQVVVYLTTKEINVVATATNCG